MPILPAPTLPAPILPANASLHRVLAAAGLGLALAASGFLAACGSEPPPPPPPPTTIPLPPPDQVNAADWEAMVACESTGNWAANTGNGFYGGLQFDVGTWSNHGGGEFAPSAEIATPVQQMEIANRVLTAQGWGAWPQCAGVAGVALKKPAPAGTFVKIVVPPQAAP